MVIPLVMAPMACSRTPKRRLRPLRSEAEKSVDDLINVLLDEARSADPPMTSGRSAAKALITAPEIALVATLAPSS